MTKKYGFVFWFSAVLLFATGILGLNFFSLNSTAQTDNVLSITSNKNPALNVSYAFWKKQSEKAMAKRDTPTGVDAPGLITSDVLLGGNVDKQKAKLAEAVENGYLIPLDFSDLASKRISGELIELPWATETYVLDVGGSATGNEFTSFDFDKNSVVLKPESSKFMMIKSLADNFDGMKYDINNAKDRRVMKIRLLRMIHPKAQKALEEIASAYHKKFNLPLRITSMTRSIEYQIELNSTDANSFVIRGKDALAPHTSGYAVDFSRNYLTAEEQNFLTDFLTEMEKAGRIDAIREGGSSQVFHVFIYGDGKPPKI